LRTLGERRETPREDSVFDFFLEEGEKG
jgi:hypothetical protein